MGVDKVTQNWEGLDLDAGADGADTTAFFDVTFDNLDSPGQRPLLAWGATDGATTVPEMWSLHPEQPTLYVRNKRVEVIGPFHFRVHVFYTTREFSPAGDSQVQPFTSPLEQPWEVDWGFITANEPIDRDIRNWPIHNSAGETFDPPIMREFSDLMLTIRRNESIFNYIRAADYKDAVNSDLFYGFAPGLVRCINYAGRRAMTADTFYWQVTYQFQIRVDNWLRRIMDEGYKALDSLDTSKGVVAIRDGDNNIVSQPWPLDGQGFALTQTQIDAGIAFWLEFEIYPLKPFRVLGLE